MSYYVTFYSHFGAMRYKKYCEQLGIKVRLMPVPRELSSSCGTCVRSENEPPVPEDFHDEIELVVKKENAIEIIYDGR